MFNNIALHLKSFFFKLNRSNRKNYPESKNIIAIEVSPEIAYEIELLKARINGEDFGAVYRKALAILDCCLSEIENGGSVILRHEDGTEDMLNINDF